MIDPASVVDTTDEERREYLRVLYESCATGREFELFLKLLLSAMELEDVSVTRYSRDGGVDLTARRAGITGDRFDEVRYVVQAKRYAPDRTVPIESVRALRGVLTQTSKGMFMYALHEARSSGPSSEAPSCRS
jgi:restriction system protein